MFGSVVMIAVGIVGLYLGGRWLVKSAARLAHALGASVLIIGLTVVAWATSAPELIVSLSAAAQGSPEMALGNVIGSNIVNIGLCLGLMALIFPVMLTWQLLRREIPIMIGVSVAALLMMLDGEISRVEGLLLAAGFVGFSALVYLLVRRERQRVTDTLETYELDEGLIDETGRISRWFEVGRLLVGLATLLIGANLTVEGATTVARSLGLSEFVIGLTLVAFGTSLPEFAASLAAAAQRQSDIAVGNIIGSNIANVLAILGLTAAVQPIPVTSPALYGQMAVMIGFSVLMLFLGFNRRIGRWKGGVLVAGYAAFVLLAFAG